MRPQDLEWPLGQPSVPPPTIVCRTSHLLGTVSLRRPMAPGSGMVFQGGKGTGDEELPLVYRFGIALASGPEQKAADGRGGKPPTGRRVSYLRWRIFALIRRFFRPTLRRPLRFFNGPTGLS